MKKEHSTEPIEETHLHITFAKIDFKCPFCLKEYNDLDDKYVDRCNKNKSGTTSVTCSCGKRFGMTYDITGQAVGFDLTADKLKKDI